MIVNATFRIDKDDTENMGNILWERCLNDSKEYERVVVYSDPDKTDKWYLDRVTDLDRLWEPCPYLETKYQQRDPYWMYLEKFDTFWFRQWVALSPVTEALVKEIESFIEHGSLEKVATYRTWDEGIIVHHLQTLSDYWD